mgnify:CR=1 FL=1
MHTLGHIGGALLVYTPVASVLSATGEPELGTIGLVIAAGVSMLPDIDEQLPIQHRGPTHTIWFVLAISVISAGVGWLVGSQFGESSTLSVVVGSAVALSLLSHLFEDSMTPMGIRPFEPLWEFDHSFGVVLAANRRANVALFGAGIVAVVIWYTATL